MGFFLEYMKETGEYDKAIPTKEQLAPYKRPRRSLNEVYFGKNKYLIQAEKLLGEARRKYSAYQSEINFSTELLEFNRVMEKAFNFEAFNLIIKHSGAINAATRPIGLIIDAPNMEMSANPKEGFRYDSPKGSIVVVYVNNGLMFNDLFTDEEVMAVIMHEIGHNFQTAISPMSRGFSYISRAVSLVTLPVIFFLNPLVGVKNLTGTRRWYYGLIDRMRQEKSGVLQVVEGLSYMLNKIVGVIGVAGDAVRSLLIVLGGPAIPIPDVSMLIDFFTSFGNVKNETIADNFATAYGYGPPLQTALHKMERKAGGLVDREFIRSIPLINYWYDFCMLPTTIINSIVSNHPNKAHRIQSQIDMLRAELKKSELDAKMKRAISAQIDKLEDQIDTSVYGLKKDKNIKGSVEESFAFTDAYSAFLLTLANGDLRSFLSKGNAKEFDAAYDRALENVKKNKYKYKF